MIAISIIKGCLPVELNERYPESSGVEKTDGKTHVALQWSAWHEHTAKTSYLDADTCHTHESSRGQVYYIWK